ncbi:MAG: hypothetical protein NTZ50_11450 [Chloroflexi bacterium]|nr:hypothetical protein [Chloroflexota bacterium]
MSHSQSTCPMCREPSLERRGARARCIACDASFEFDGVGRKVRLSAIPARFAEWRSVLAGRWFTRPELFAAVDEAQAAEQAAADDDGADNEDALFRDDDDAAAAAAAEGDWARLLPLVLVTGVFVLGCLCAAGAALAAMALAVSNLWTAGPTPTVLPAGSGTPPPAQPSLATVVGVLDGTAAMPPAESSAPLPERTPSSPENAPQQPIATATRLPVAEQPIEPTRPRRAFPLTPEPPLAEPPTAEPPPAEPPTAEPPTPAPLVSPLNPPPADLLPPTFTPPAAEQTPASPTPVQASPTPPPPTATPPPAGPQPTATPTYAPGEVTSAGDLHLSVNFNDPEYVEITNKGSKEVQFTGMKLRALIPGRPANDPSLTHDLLNGGSILGNQTCRIYTRNRPLNDGQQCKEEWGIDSGNLWPDTPGKGVTVVLLDAEGHELVRVTY